MEVRELQESTQFLKHLILVLLLLFAAAYLSSYLASLGGGIPDAAFGIEDSADGFFTLPDNPLLKIWVWEKDYVEQRELIQLEACTPVNTGPSVAWNSGCEYVSYFMPYALDGLTFTAVGEGIITAEWEHADGYDCGHTHTWWYSDDPELTGGVNTGYLCSSTDGTASGVNNLCMMWRGTGGYAADTRGKESELLANARHKVTPLTDTMGHDEEGLHYGVSQDSLAILIHITCTDLLGHPTAAATLRAEMVSGWRGAADIWQEKRLAAERAEERGEEPDLKWLDIALVQPTWTLEMIRYGQIE